MKRNLVLAVTLLTSLVGCTPALPPPPRAAQAQPMDAMANHAAVATPPTTVDEKIRSAMSAGPAAITQDSTILDFPTEAGKPMGVLRKGTGEWTCYPDWPASPGNDPQCLDQVWMEWNDTFSAGTPYTVTRLGLAYMLQGGSDPSNMDPFASAPKEGEDWVVTPPHIMILIPGELDPAQFTTDHHSGKPYIMYAGTPYAHIMMPINPN